MSKAVSETPTWHSFLIVVVLTLEAKELAGLFQIDLLRYALDPEIMGEDYALPACSCHPLTDGHAASPGVISHSILPASESFNISLLKLIWGWTRKSSSSMFVSGSFILEIQTLLQVTEFYVSKWDKGLSLLAGHPQSPEHSSYIGCTGSYWVSIYFTPKDACLINYAIAVHLSNLPLFVRTTSLTLDGKAGEGGLWKLGIASFCCSQRC